MALLVNARGEVYFVKKTAPNSGKTYLTLPGGMVEKNEDPITALRREVFEEIGLKINQAKYLTTLEILPGYLVGKTHLYYCPILDSSTIITDKSEILGVKKIKLDLVFKKINGGEITDSRTVAALLFSRNFPQKL